MGAIDARTVRLTQLATFCPQSNPSPDTLSPAPQTDPVPGRRWDG